MSRNFDIRPSPKKSLDSKDMYAVSRGKTVFLRILGDGKYYEVMTATVGEDYDRTRVCVEKQRLIKSAILTSK